MSSSIPKMAFTGGWSELLPMIGKGMSPKSPKTSPTTTTAGDTTTPPTSTPESPLVRKRRQQDELRARAGGTMLSDASGGETLG